MRPIALKGLGFMSALALLTGGAYAYCKTSRTAGTTFLSWQQLNQTNGGCPNKRYAEETCKTESCSWSDLACVPVDDSISPEKLKILDTAS